MKLVAVLRAAVTLLDPAGVAWRTDPVPGTRRARPPPGGRRARPRIWPPEKLPIGTENGTVSAVAGIDPMVW